MTDLRAEARGRDCQVRLIGVCNFDPSTTVLAHVRMAGITGIGQKSSDFHACWSCSSCHDRIDFRVPYKVDGWDDEKSRMYVQIAMYEAVIRTHYQLIKQGKVKL